MQISCGADHTLACTSSGKVFSWGRNSSGQTGQGTSSNLTSPRLIQGLSFEHITQVKMIPLLLDLIPLLELDDSLVKLTSFHHARQTSQLLHSLTWLRVNVTFLCHSGISSLKYGSTVASVTIDTSMSYNLSQTLWDCKCILRG